MSRLMFAIALCLLCCGDVSAQLFGGRMFGGGGCGPSGCGVGGYSSRYGYEGSNAQRPRLTMRQRLNGGSSGGYGSAGGSGGGYGSAGGSGGYEEVNETVADPKESAANAKADEKLAAMIRKAPVTRYVYIGPALSSEHALADSRRMPHE